MPGRSVSKLQDGEHGEDWDNVQSRWRSELTNVGEMTPRFKSSGTMAPMAFQATTDVQEPLAAASKIAAKGNRIVLDDAASESYIENQASGVRIPLKIENGVYMMEMTVVLCQGQARP